MSARLTVTALALALAFAACSTRTPPLAPVSPPEPEQVGELLQPYVLVVTGPKPCAPGQTDLWSVVHADADYASKRLDLHAPAPNGQLGENGVVLENPSAAELNAALEGLAKTGKLVPGLVFVYSGHGVRQGSDKDGRSMLCLRDGAFDAQGVARALGKTPEKQLPWLAMVLNACESAYIDISPLSRPTAVLAASPGVISVHAFPDANRRAGSCRPALATKPVAVQATPFVRATVDSLADPSSPDHDRNEDGIVTMHELFHILADAAAKDWHGCSLSRPEPRFQLQARSEVPIRYHREAVDTRRRVEAIVRTLRAQHRSPGLDALLTALRAQLDLPTRRVLPEVRWDFVISASDDVAMRIPPIETATGGDQCWGHLPYLALAPRELSLDERLLLGRFSIFSSFYWIKRWNGTVDVTQLGEQALGDPSPVRTFSLGEAVASIPPRIQMVSDRMFLAKTAIPQAEDCQRTILQDVLAHRHFRVCAEEEGQCFVH
jgi:hypothetical protein